MAIQVGQPAPDFTLYDTEKKQRSLSEFRGHNVLLLFFSSGIYQHMHKRIV